MSTVDEAHDRWFPLPESPLGPRDRQVMVWAGDDQGNGCVVIWGGYVDKGQASYVLHDGARYYPRDDHWERITDVGAPTARTGASAVWTGERVLIWGGNLNTGDPGASYDPVTDTWDVIPGNDLNLANDALSVWTGKEFIVYGGGQGSRYDPLSQVWRRMSNVAAPFGADVSGVWTGELLLVWGGYAGFGSAQATSYGAAYDPKTDVWTPLPSANAPSARFGHVAVWTGTEMLIWGGSDTDVLSDGGLYDPRTKTWTAIPAPAALPQVPVYYGGAVMSGPDMLVWGGYGGHSLAPAGARYARGGDWSELPTLDQPSLRIWQGTVWTGVEMVVWGGVAASELATGARYVP